MNEIYIVTDCDLIASIVHEIYMTELGEDWPVRQVPTDQLDLLQPADESTLVISRRHNALVRQLCFKYPNIDFLIVNFDEFDIDDVHEKVSRLLSQTSSKNFLWRGKRPRAHLMVA